MITIACGSAVKKLAGRLPERKTTGAPGRNALNSALTPAPLSSQSASLSKAADKDSNVEIFSTIRSSGRQACKNSFKKLVKKIIHPKSTNISMTTMSKTTVKSTAPLSGNANGRNALRTSSTKTVTSAGRNSALMNARKSCARSGTPTSTTTIMQSGFGISKSAQRILRTKL